MTCLCKHQIHKALDRQDQLQKTSKTLLDKFHKKALSDQPLPSYGLRQAKIIQKKCVFFARPAISEDNSEKMLWDDLFMQASNSQSLGQARSTAEDFKDFIG
mmetsp:Transcript_110060/g.206352  ORF Transcript_110060/g.206352 Transcript_110060/m.206352 type:complete len:102 (+) Transcript_110060:99-404(+)